MPHTSPEALVILSKAIGAPVHSIEHAAVLIEATSEEVKRTMVEIERSAEHLAEIREAYEMFAERIMAWMERPDQEIPPVIFNLVTDLQQTLHRLIPHEHPAGHQPSTDGTRSTRPTSPDFNG